MPHVLVDRVEVNLSLICSAIVIDFRVADMIELGRARQPFDFDALLHQGQVLVCPVVPNAQVLLAFLQHDLDWLQSKALLRHALNASYLVVSIWIDFLYSFGEDIEA